MSAVDPSTALAQECRRLEESCLYTSTSFFLWLRSRRRLKTAFIVAPLLLGSAASWKLLTEVDLQSVRTLTSIFAFAAGVLPGIYSALKFDDQLQAAARAAAQFKNLQDRFRRLADVGSLKPFPQFEREVNAAVARLERARSGSLTPPEWFFTEARKKIKSGDYSYDVDEK